MIKVIDNIINKEEQENIKNFLFNDTQWSLISDVSHKDNKHQRRPGFKKVFHQLHPSIDLLLKETAKKVKKTNETLLEARTFLQLPLNKEYIGTGVDTPHLDRTTPHTVFLYYVTDSDGDTVIYDYKSKDENDIPYFEDVKELKRVKPKQGRVVVFDGLHWHTAEQPTKDIRCIINFNICK